MGGIWTSEQLIAGCDVILLPKVQAEDLAEMLVGQIIWGWPHCVQDSALTQVAIDRRLTLIALEAVNHWQVDGGFGLHVFVGRRTSWLATVQFCTQCNWRASRAAMAAASAPR